MFKKTIKIFTALTLLIAGVRSVFATDQYPAYPTPQAPSNQGLFVMGSLGGGLTYWNNLVGTAYSSTLIGPGGPTVPPFTGTLNNFNAVSNASGFAWGVSGGFQFNQYLAFQTDYVRFRNILVTDSRFNYVNGVLTSAIVNYNYQVSEYGIGIFARGSVPLFNTSLEVYTKLGAGYLRAKGTGAIATVGNWGPAFGAGMNYLFSNGLTLGVSWTRYSGSSKLGSTTFIPNADFIAANLGYFFQM